MSGYKRLIESRSRHLPILSLIVLSLSVCALLLAGCDGGISGLFGGGSSETKVKFSIPALARSAGERAASQAPLPNEILYYDISDSSATLRHKTLVVGQNEVTMAKGSINVVGFAYNPSLARGLGDSAKSASGPIQLIGGLKILSAGLDSLPIADSADDEIPLGNLTISGKSVTSAVDAATLSTATGYSTADTCSYSFFDDGLIQLLNPDVDGNGVYDADENRQWQITASRDGGTFYRDDFSGTQPAVPVQSLIGPLFSMVFWLNGAFPHPDYSTVFLEFPADYVYTDGNGAIVTGNYASWHGTGEGPGGEFNQYYFNYLNSEISSPVPPFPGDYKLTIDGATYEFDNLSFLTPTEGSPEGFIFPETRITYDNDDYVQKLYYSWWTVRNGVSARATEEEVRLTAKQYYYYFPKIWVKTPEDFGQVYYCGGVMDLSSYGIKKSELGGVAGEPNSLRSVYWDRMGNEWNFNYRYDEDRPLN